MSSFRSLKSLIWLVLVTLSICEDSVFFANGATTSGDNSQLFYSRSPPMRMGDFDFVSEPEIAPKLRRRASGFVPMRGKKDAPLNYMEQAPRELDQDATLSRFANVLQAQQQGPTNPNNQLESNIGLANNNWQPVVAVPRQFFYQMTNHHQNQEPSEQAGTNYDNNWQSGSNVQNPLGWGQQATNSMLMEAKLRRAFHPMRGKRAGLANSENVLISED